MVSYKPIPFKPIYYITEGGRARLLVLLWLFACLLIVPSGMLTRILELTGIPLQVYGLQLHITVYLPMIICVPLCLTFGFLWAAIPAYLSTFFVALIGDMPLFWIVAFSFANPIGLAMLVMIYRITPSSINLQSVPAFLFFVVASFLASLSGSIGSFIWTYTNQVDLHDFFRVWQGWWMGGFLQSVLICAPLLYFFADKLNAWRLSCFPDNEIKPETRSAIKMAIILITFILITFTWLALQVSLMNIEGKVSLVVDADIKNDIIQAVEVVSFPVLVYISILAFIGYFIFYFVDYWALRLEKINDELKKQNDQLYELSIKDNLTKLYNRGYFFNQVPEVVKSLRKGGKSIAFILIDLDHFKHVNDQYGHLAGDQILKEFSVLMKNQAIPGQVIARFGGEEFIFLAPQLRPEEVRSMFENLINKTLKHEFIYKEKSIGITISVGAYVTRMLDQSIDHMIDQADQALYQAKNNGRNQLVLKSD